MSSSPPLIVADRYRLVAPLGQGGMGRVWRANDVVLHRDVAIKELVPPPGLTPGERQEMRERSLREARAIARLNNVNVVRVFDVLRTDADPWIVMEFVDSRSLHDTLAADGPFSAVRAAEIGLGVLNALRAAHRAGVVHRDVKPGNVLIGADGRVVLTDFGLATVPGDPNVTRTGLVLGSPAYIAPERARDGTAGPAADLWSLGATLYAAVEGASPFARPSAIATLAALATENPPQARNAGPLKPVLNGLLRKDPTHRINAEEAERLLLRATGRRSKLSFPMSPTMRRPGLGRALPPTGAMPVVPGPRPPVAPARQGNPPARQGNPPARPANPPGQTPASGGRVAAGEGRPPVFVPGKATVGRPPDKPTRVDAPKADASRLDPTRVDGPPVRDGQPPFGTRQPPPPPATPPSRPARSRPSETDPMLARTVRGGPGGFTAADVAAARRKKAAPEHERSLADAMGQPGDATTVVPPSDKTRPGHQPSGAEQSALADATTVVPPPDRTRPGQRQSAAPVDATTVVPPHGGTRRPASADATTFLPPQDDTRRSASADATTLVPPRDDTRRPASADATTLVPAPARPDRKAGVDPTTVVPGSVDATPADATPVVSPAAGPSSAAPAAEPTTVVKHPAKTAPADPTTVVPPAPRAGGKKPTTSQNDVDASKADSAESGTTQPDAEGPEGDKAGANKPGINGLNAEEPGAAEVDVDGLSADEAGADKAGVDKAGVDKAGVDKAGADKAGADEATDPAGEKDAGSSGDGRADSSGGRGAGISADASTAASASGGEVSAGSDVEADATAEKGRRSGAGSTRRKQLPRKAAAVEAADALEVADVHGGREDAPTPAASRSAVEEAPVSSDGTSPEVDAAETKAAADAAAEDAGEAEEPGTEEPGTEEPGTEEPGTEEPGTEEPGTGETSASEVVAEGESGTPTEGESGRPTEGESGTPTESETTTATAAETNTATGAEASKPTKAHKSEPTGVKSESASEGSDRGRLGAKSEPAAESGRGTRTTSGASQPAGSDGRGSAGPGGAESAASSGRGAAESGGRGSAAGGHESAGADDPSDAIEDFKDDSGGAQVALPLARKRRSKAVENRAVENKGAVDGRGAENEGADDGGRDPALTMPSNLPPFSPAARPLWKPMDVSPTVRPSAGVTIFGTRLTYRQAAIGAAALLVVLLLVIVLAVKAFGGGGGDKPSAAPGVSGSVATGGPVRNGAGPAPATTTPSLKPSLAASSTPSQGPTSGAAVTLPAGWKWYNRSTQGDWPGFTVPIPQNASVEPEGSQIYIRWNNRLLIVDRTNAPQSDPVQDWKNQEGNRSYRDYHKIKIVPVTYGGFKSCADWEFTYTTDNGNAQHADKRNILVSNSAAYSLNWYTTPEDWGAAGSDLQAIYRGFQAKP